ncbi:hypothetical protein GTY75_05300 [Streptomyces sp. SID8381]|uniref:hypothetical protein n=1 Tax=unclassified Streptomyces TaxID=2593676 RepID=UPI0003A6A253|nr:MULTISPECIES: hypothetical protein [unclassified Streptomyces]MYX26090.1 hypothetical protein [Streptomyces sp. SID8381]
MVINDRKAYAEFRQSNSDADWYRWGAAAELTRRTNPLVRGTVSMGGGLIPLKNAYHLYR